MSTSSVFSGRSTSDVDLDQLVSQLVAATSPAGERVLFHVPSGTYLKVDRAASTIFDLLVEHENIDTAADALAAMASISIERARGDVAAVVEVLRGLRPSRTIRPRRSTVRGMCRTTVQWWSLPLSLRVSVIKAVFVVSAVEVGIWTVDIRKLAKWSGVPLATDTAELPRSGTADIEALSPREQRVHWATAWVLDRWIFEGTCLRRALATGYFLRRRDPVLHLGLTGNGETAHAWVEAEGMTFNAAEVTGVFVRPERLSTLSS